MKCFLIILVFVLIGTSSFSQSRIYLQHQQKPQRQKNINLRRDYTIRTTNQLFQDYRISNFTDSTLLIKANHSDTTQTLLTKDILTMRKGKKFQIIEITAYVAMIGLTITPVIWALEGGDEALGALEAFGTLLAITAPVILLREIGRTKDTQVKWRIVVVN